MDKDLFELALANAGYESVKKGLRAHDAAQREALAEAVRLLRFAYDHAEQHWPGSLPNEQKVRAFLAQPEQQDARPCLDCKGTGKPLDPVEHGDDYGYCESCGATGRVAQEAQSVQARDERAAFESAYQRDANDDVGEVRTTRQIAWAFWQARAALATQPAAYVLTKDGEIYWEGDDGIVISNTQGDCIDESYEWRPVGFLSQHADKTEYAAPHQIADALESLEWKGCSIGHKVVLANAVAALRAVRGAE